MSKPVISLFLDNFEEGGVQRAIINLTRGFIDRNIKVDIVLSKAVGPFLKQVPDGVRVVDLGNPRLRSSVFVLANYLRREQPKALIASLHFSTEIAILAKYVARVSTKVIVWEHGALVDVRPSIKNLKEFFGLTPYNATTLIKALYPFADGVVGCSSGTARQIVQVMGCLPNRVKTIYNPVITPELIEKAKAPVGHPWFQHNQPPVILATGRLVAQKDYPMLIQAFALVQPLKSARLMILGTGSDRPHLEALIRQLGLELDISMPGFVENPYSYMAKSAVFVLSSIWEGLGNVLIEAMATGVPVVSTDCKNGPAEILDCGKYGELVPVGDKQAMADGLLKVLSGQKKPVPPTWLEQFTIRNVTQQYLDVCGVNAPN
jgi:glycosyltransferase involved in cell wall biosynthesis